MKKLFTVCLLLTLPACQTASATKQSKHKITGPSPFDVVQENTCVADYSAPWCASDRPAFPCWKVAFEKPWLCQMTCQDQTVSEVVSCTLIH